MKNSTSYILKRFLDENEIKVDSKELEFQLQSHPSYPSLQSLTGVLDHFNINNLSLEVPNDKETLIQLPKSFIAYIKDERWDDFALVTILESNIQLVFGENEKKYLSNDEFLKAWTGIIVAVEKDDGIVAIHKAKTLDLVKVLVPSIMLGLFIVFFASKIALFQSFHFILSFIGLGISIIIIKHELGMHSVIADKFCSGKIEKINCDDVLNSKASSFFDLFKLSDVGIVYFTAVILSSLFLINNNPVNDNPLIIISLLALPFTIYSIVYQYFIVKKWCLLCLSIILILWLQAISLFFVDFKLSNLSLSVNSIALVAISFLFNIVLWQFILPKLRKERELNKLKIEHYRFKRNYNIYKALITRFKPIDTAIQGIHEIEFVAKTSPLIEILIVTNPLCSYCRETHSLISEILKRGNEKIKIIIRFNVSNDFNAIDTRIALRLLEIYNTGGMQQCLDAMYDIYFNFPPVKWLDKWGESLDLKYKEVLQKEKQWCRYNNIDFTPETLVNGMAFPKEYEKKDLIYFIDDIIEEEQLKVEELSYAIE